MSWVDLEVDLSKVDVFAAVLRNNRGALVFYC